MSDNVPACNEIYDQLRKSRIIASPPIRFNLTSPYPTYTPTQLDMRRKAEILKYNGVSQNTKTNGFTKSEKWAQLARGKTVPYSQYVIRNTSCSVASLKENIPTPSSSCGVPGPIVYLINDPTIPLYNYVNSRVYGITNPDKIMNWIIESTVNSYTDGVPATIFTLYIQPLIANPVYTYTLKTPISIVVQGNATEVLNIAISNVKLGVYYNGGLVTSSTTSSASWSNHIMKITPSGPFTATQYAGMVIISDIFLLTQPTYVYEFKLTFALPTIKPGTTVSIICDYKNSNSGCTVGVPSSDSPSDQTLLGV